MGRNGVGNVELIIGILGGWGVVLIRGIVGIMLKLCSLGRREILLFRSRYLYEHSMDYSTISCNLKVCTFNYVCFKISLVQPSQGFLQWEVMPFPFR